MRTRVLEIGNLAAGYCGKLFHAAGADVVRIPDALPPMTDAWASAEATALFLHHGKEQAPVDQLRKLAERSDVIIAEGTPQQLEALNWAQLPGIKVAITPFGMTGPRRAWHASSSVLLAMGGYTHLMGDPDKPPLTLPGHYVEYQSGQHAYVAASGCLYAEEQRSVDVSMLEVVLSLSQMTTVMYSCNGVIRTRHGNRFGVLHPIALFPCKDGWYHINVVPTFWPTFCSMLEAPELEQDPRFAKPDDRVSNADALDAEIYQRLGNKTKAEIFALGERHRVPTGILQTVDELLADPHLNARDFWQPLGDHLQPRLPFHIREESA